MLTSEGHAAAESMLNQVTWAGTWLQPKTMSVSMVLPQSGSVLMSVAQGATKGRMDFWV